MKVRFDAKAQVQFDFVSLRYNFSSRIIRIYNPNLQSHTLLLYNGFAQTCLVKTQLPLFEVLVGRFQSSMHKWGLALTSISECGALDQTAFHLILECLLHRDP